jgi:hypothetical protein
MFYKYQFFIRLLKNDWSFYYSARFYDFYRHISPPPSRSLPINRTIFFLRTGAFLGFGRLLAFAGGFFKALDAIISFFF